MTNRIAAGALIAASLVFAGSLVAAATPEELVEARQNQMKTFGRSAKAIGDFLKAGGDGDMAPIREAAVAIEDGAGKLPTLFPEGTGVGVSDSEALPAIWENPDRFAQRIDALRVAAAGLTEAAGNGDARALAAAFRPVGQACGGCHEQFRLDD